MPNIKYKQTKDHILKRALSKRRGSFFNCLVCSDQFWRQPAYIKKGDCKFCSRECYQTWQKGKTKNSGFKLNPLRKEKNPNWKGGITPISMAIRNSKEMKLWKESIFKRDNWTCKKCFKRSEKGNYVYIEAHHIKPFSLFPELRFEISNGITLCKKCHSKEPKGREIYAICK